MKHHFLILGVILFLIGVFLLKSGNYEMFMLSLFFIPLGTTLTFIEATKILKTN
jgi:NADH:ubiquinone oxidoreductase subunit K